MFLFLFLVSCLLCFFLLPRDVLLFLSFSLFFMASWGATAIPKSVTEFRVSIDRINGYFLEDNRTILYSDTWGRQPCAI